MKKFRWQLLIILITGLVVGLLLLLQQGSTAPEVESTISPIRPMKTNGKPGIFCSKLIASSMPTENDSSRRTKGISRQLSISGMVFEPQRVVQELAFEWWRGCRKV